MLGSIGCRHEEAAFVDGRVVEVNFCEVGLKRGRVRLEMVDAVLETNEAASRELEIDRPRVVISLRLFGVQLNAPLNLFWNNEQLFYLDGSLLDNISLDSRLVAKLLRLLGYMPMLSIFVTGRSWVRFQLIKLFNENLPI